MKGIILAGGANTRLHPVTNVVSKQLLPVYDKPMVYYPLSLLMLAGIREILVISTPRDTPKFEALLGDGSSLGLHFEYAVQERPAGIADAFRVGRSFVNGEACALVLGDNILYGHSLPEMLQRASAIKEGAVVFGYEVHDPERFGIVEIGPDKRAISLEEKPTAPKSPWAVIGLYFYDHQVCDVAADLAPSARGEVEITDVNRWYLEKGLLTVEQLGRGIAWLDGGTFDSLHEAAEYVRILQTRQNWRISCVEEIAYRMGFIDLEQLRKNGERLAKSDYGQYVLDLANGESEGGR